MLFQFILGSSMLLILLFSSSLALKVTAINESSHNNDSESATNIVKPNSPSAGYIDSGNNNESTRSNDNPLNVFTSFYPVYDFVKKIGKDKVDVSIIVPNGLEPHDFEPTAKQIIDLQKADAIFVNGMGFESWINKLNSVTIVDLSRDLPLEKNTQTSNPHIWLDPLLVKLQAKNILNSLNSLDPQNKLYYNSNYVQFTNHLDKLNVDIVSNLTNCKLHDFLSFHDAFGYFANRYGLIQHSIQGLSPETEAPPQKIRESIDLSKQLGLDVVFTEDNMDPRLSDIIAQEINGQVLTLSPIETISDEEKQMNKDYFSKMYDNLNNLKIALKCTN
ncbi:MAG TPA: zinc ABC transporter substrate-binding protein [Phototrophicaceae bacterium]|nr:zinc ABC transporter substrate-binding protein [Phototrophicaceae bacterium]